MVYSAALLTCIHVGLATTVTGHVLLNKRNAGSSAAWIGLAWLSPLLGSVLYVLLGVNRVRRRAVTLRARKPTARALESDQLGLRDDPLCALELAGRHITQRNLEGGNALTILRNGDEAYPEMIAAIEAAQQSLVLSSYLFRADAAGNDFIDALARAARRGVQTRVLVDGIGGGYFLSAAYRKLHRAKVPVARFLHSPLPWRMPFLNLRNHRKILVVDGRLGFTGGLNIGAENLTRQHPRRPVFDTHFRCEGPVVAQLVEAFAEDWFFSTGEQLTGSAWFPCLGAAGSSFARVLTSGPGQDIEKIEYMILAAVGAARTSVEIMTPYFVPDERIITALALAALRGVAVDVVLPGHSDHPAVDWAAVVQITPMLQAGCRVWTNAPPFDHSKLMAVDGVWALIGSANWDVRSFRLNFELDLEVYYSELVRQVSEQIAEHRGTAVTVPTLQQHSFFATLRNSAARLLLPYL